ncbi:hypothetical protein P3S68_012281 [Capsicum galapagoense]
MSKIDKNRITALGVFLCRDDPETSSREQFWRLNQKIFAYARHWLFDTLAKYIGYTIGRKISCSALVLISANEATVDAESVCLSLCTQMLETKGQVVAPDS